MSENILTVVENNTNTKLHQNITTHELQPHEPTIYAETVFTIGSFKITNALLTSWLALFIIIVISIRIRTSMKKIPGTLQLVFETLLDGALNLGDQVTGDRALTEKILPIALVIFMFVLVNNWLGIIPGIGSIGQLAIHDGHTVMIPYLRGGTADINTTIGLSIFTIIGANIFGIISIGLWNMFNKFVNLKALGKIFTDVKKDPTILIVAPITFFVGLVEIIGEIAKIASLSFRLFGNVFAGEVLLAAMAGIFAFGIPIPFLFLEILVGGIQALIFAILTMVYFTIASQDHDHDNDEHDLQYELNNDLIQESLVVDGLVQK